MAKTTVKLNVEEESVIFAISTNLRDFQFCDFVNTTFQVELQAQEQVEVILPSGQVVKPLRFSYCDEIRKQKFTIIDNQTNGGPFVDFMKNINFFLKITQTKGEEQEYQKKLANNLSIIYIQQVDYKNFPQRQKLIFKSLFQKI